MSRESIELELKSFKYNIQKMMDAEEKYLDISRKLEGELPGASVVKMYKGIKIYSNHITGLMLSQADLESKRNYYLFSVRKVASYLQLLDPEEVELLELRYYKKFEVYKVAKCMNYDKRTVYRKLDTIFEKITKKAIY